jgi:hypothetical protein
MLTLALLVAALPALARENHALLIGVSQYPALDQKYWLKGPANDVALVKTYLTSTAPVPFAADHVVVLADGIAGALSPTLAAIRNEFATLTAKVQPGDFVYLHFSGHGTQAPAADPDSELDGLDELFLPRDIGPWTDATAAVQNGLVDDEIGQLVDGLRAKGANVWAVFDSCHSGTVTRGAPDGDEEVRSRQLPPEALGLDPDQAQTATRALQDPRAKPEAPFDAGENPGSFVAFFAAQTDEVTPEKNLPKGKPGRVPQGVFTYTLFEVLAEYPSATYGQIGQEVLRKYATKSLARATPMFEGDLDQVAFAGTAGARVAQWPATKTDGGFTIPAGSLHGLREGVVLAVMANAAAETADAIGYVELLRVDTFTATAKPVSKDGMTFPEKLPKGLLLRKIGSDLDFTLTVSLPEPGSAPADALAAAMGAMNDASGPRITFAAPGAPEADLRLAVLPDSPRPDAIWVLAATGLVDDLSTTPSVSTADKDPLTLGTTMADMLTSMAKAINLMKLAGAVGSESLDVEIAMLTGPSKAELQPMPASGVPRLVPDDQVHILAENHMDVPVDVNVLYIGADWSISHWAAERLLPGGKLTKGLFKISDAVLGHERMVVVMTPAAPQSTVENLSFLAQDALDLTRDVRGPAGNFKNALIEAGFGETTRAAAALDEGDDTGPQPAMLQLELRTVAAD